MPVKTYLNAYGMMLAEIEDRVRTDYLTDAHGSITGTVDQSGALTSTREAKPYGAVLHETGRPPLSDSQIADNLRFNCKWSTEVAALWLAILQDPKCQNGEPETCEQFIKLWNSSQHAVGKEFRRLAKCAYEALKKNNPCEK